MEDGDRKLLGALLHLQTDSWLVEQVVVLFCALALADVLLRLSLRGLDPTRMLVLEARGTAKHIKSLAPK